MPMMRSVDDEHGDDNNDDNAKVVCIRLLNMTVVFATKALPPLFHVAWRLLTRFHPNEDRDVDNNLDHISVARRIRLGENPTRNSEMGFVRRGVLTQLNMVG